MSRADLMERLREAGLSLTRNQIQDAIDSGKVPRPRKNGSGKYCFTEEHLRRFAEIFK